MPDLRLITILPSQTVSGVQQPQGSGTQAATAAPGVLPPPGTILSGFIVNRDTSGNPVLRTVRGDIAFQTAFFLNIGSEVVIRIENNPAGTLAHILSVDGESPETAATRSLFTQEPEVIVSQALGAAKSTPATLSAASGAAPATITVSATVIKPPPIKPFGLPYLPADTQLTLKLTALTQAAPQVPEEFAALAEPLPASASPTVNSFPASSLYAAYARIAGETPVATTPPAPPLTAAPPVASSATPAAPVTVANANIIPPPPQAPPATAAIPDATPGSPLPPTTATTPGVTQVVPLSPTTPPPAAAAPETLPHAVISPAPDAARIITATVLSNEPGGEAIVRTPIGIVRLQPGTVLPTGSQLTFEITSTTAPPQNPITGTSATAAPVPAAELAQHWESLHQIVALLAQRSDNAVPDFLQASLPWLPAANTSLPPEAPPPPPVHSGLMFFIAALRGGDFNGWLGQGNAEWIRSQGHEDLLRKAGAEFITMAKQFTDPPQQQWQTLFFPIAIGGELQQARLFVKRDRKQGGNQDQAKKNGDTRFVVEVGLSQLGEMQMDGFVRREEQAVQFDMVIRSHLPLPPDVQRDILQIYNDTGALTGYKGSLVFQAVREFPVKPMEELIAHAMGAMEA